jgi:hypothetical protein
MKSEPQLKAEVARLLQLKKTTKTTLATLNDELFSRLGTTDLAGQRKREELYEQRQALESKAKDYEIRIQALEWALA